MPVAVVRWTWYIVCLVVLGPIAGALAALPEGPDGSAGTALASRAPVEGVLGLMGGLALAACAGAASGRMVGQRAAMSCAGLIVLWMAARTASVSGLVRASGHGPWPWLVAEGAVVAAGLAVVGVAIALATRRRPAQADGPEDEHGVSLAWRSAPAVAAAGVAGGVVGAAIAVTPLKGQAIAAAVLAAVAAAMVVRLVDRRTPALGAVLAVGVLAIASPAALLASVAPGDALAATYAGDLPSLGLLTPLDWAAGALLGVPVGLAWAGSIQRRSAHA